MILFIIMHDFVMHTTVGCAEELIYPMRETYIFINAADNIKEKY